MSKKEAIQAADYDEEMTVTMELEDGESVTCAIITILTVNEKDYIILLPLDEKGMNIQIFGKKKCFDTRKAERYFKERGIRFQSVDLAQKGLSRGELESVLAACGGLDAVIDEKNKDFALIHYLTSDAQKEKLLEQPSFLKTPIVRNGRLATVGYQPDVWKSWE